MSEPVCTCDSDNVSSPASPPLHFECLHATSASCSSEVNEKLIELVCKCEELYDMSNKKYRDSVWKEILCGQIGEELKKNQLFSMFLYCAFCSYFFFIL